MPDNFSKGDAQAIAALAEVWTAAAARQDSAAVAALYTEDAMLLSPNRPVIEGRAGIQDWFEQLPNFTEMHSEVVEVVGRDDLAVVRGQFRMMLELDGVPPIRERGKLLQVLRRQTDGSWLIWRESFNADTPRGPMPRPPAN